MQTPLRVGGSVCLLRIIICQLDISKLAETAAMIISKRIEVNIYLTEPQLSAFDTEEHRELTKISGKSTFGLS